MIEPFEFWPEPAGISFVPAAERFAIPMLNHAEHAQRPTFESWERELWAGE